MSRKMLVIVSFIALLLGVILAGCKVKESPNARQLRLMNEATLEQILSQALTAERSCKKLAGQFNRENLATIGFVDIEYGSAWEYPYTSDHMFNILSYTEYPVVVANFDGWYENGYVLINNPLSTTPGWTYIGEGMCFVK